MGWPGSQARPRLSGVPNSSVRLPDPAINQNSFQSCFTAVLPRDK